MPGDEDDETADGEDIWFVNALGPQEKNIDTFQCGPCKLIKHHYSVPVEWLILDELTDEYAIFKVWPTEQVLPQPLCKYAYSLTTTTCYSLYTVTYNYASTHCMWQDRIAVTHLMDMPDLKWDKVENGKRYMSRTQYDFCNAQM